MARTITFRTNVVPLDHTVMEPNASVILRQVIAADGGFDLVA